MRGYCRNQCQRYINIQLLHNHSKQDYLQRNTQETVKLKHDILQNKDNNRKDMLESKR